MTLHVDDAKLIAINTIRDRFPDSVELVRVESMPSPAYGFNPSGWLLFGVRQSDVFRVQGDWIVAVHAETGEFRDLGRLGD